MSYGRSENQLGSFSFLIYLLRHVAIPVGALVVDDVFKGDAFKHMV